MSIVRYNGITLPYANTVQFRQEAVYDDTGSTDWYCTKFDIRVQSTIHAAYMGMLAPELVDGGAPVTDNAAVIMAAVRTTLLQPRRTLSFTFNGEELIPQAQGSNAGTVDAQNGPMPQSCTVIKLNNITFLVDYHITAHYWENNSVNPETDPIVQNFNGNNTLYNRWTETQELDGCQFSRYVREGKFVIRSDNKDGLFADQIRRQMAVVGIRNGFLRKSSRYTVSPDGLAIQYRVVDEEVFRKPPAPAFEADGEYTETVTRGQAFRIGECRVVLRGDKLTSQTQLVDVAVGLASQKILSRVTQLGTGVGLIENGYVRTDMFRNEVECVIRAMYAADPDRLGGQGNDNTIERVAAFVGMKTEVPGSVANYQPPYLLHGTANFLLQAAAYYDPSLTATVMDPAANQMSTGLVPGQAGRTPED